MCRQTQGIHDVTSIDPAQRAYRTVCVQLTINGYDPTRSSKHTINGRNQILAIYCIVLYRNDRRATFLMVPSFLWGSRTIRMLQNLFPNVIKNEKITAKTYNSANRNPEMGIVLYSRVPVTPLGSSAQFKLYFTDLCGLQNPKN